MKIISGFKHYFPQVPCNSAAKSKKNKPVNPTIKLSNWNELFIYLFIYFFNSFYWIKDKFYNVT